MHYNHPDILRDQILKIIVYKHQDGDIKYGKDGLLLGQSVDYEVASVRHCYGVRPRLLADIIKAPFKYLNKHLSALPFEHWYLITLGADETGCKVGDIHVKDVTEEADPTLFLH